MKISYAQSFNLLSYIPNLLVLSVASYFFVKTKYISLPLMVIIDIIFIIFLYFNLTKKIISIYPNGKITIPNCASRGK